MSAHNAKCNEKFIEYSRYCKNLILISNAGGITCITYLNHAKIADSLKKERYLSSCCTVIKKTCVLRLIKQQGY